MNLLKHDIAEAIKTIWTYKKQRAEDELPKGKEIYFYRIMAVREVINYKRNITRSPSR